MLTLKLGDYWIVNQILSKGLHNADQECLEYTTHMMDKLEKVGGVLCSHSSVLT
jgi:vacuolar protein sorting-associated protein VTA1